MNRAMNHPIDCPCVMCDPCQARWRQSMGIEKKETMKATISTYLDDGRVFEYDILAPEDPLLGSLDLREWQAAHLDAKAREHAAAIVTGGYRHNNESEFEHYPPHRVLKVKVVPAPSTSYPDRVRGT